MNIVIQTVKCIVGCIGLCLVVISPGAFAQSNTYSFAVVEGRVVVTPAWCRVNPCAPTTARLSGNFVAQISAAGDRILFPSSSVTTSPDVYFQLPTDPDDDSGGVVRDIAFTFVGDDIKATGYVDSRAFDGPLIEYVFAARVIRSEVFSARPDYRKCAAPLCGGYFVKLVNQKLTRCADGSLQEECYVASVTYGGGPLAATAHSFNNRTPLLLIGAILPKNDDHVGRLGIFVAKDAYRSATQVSATETFYAVNNNGIMCITTPCFSYDQLVLNGTSRITKLSDVNLELSGAVPDDIAEAQALLANGGVLYAAGKNQKYRDFAGTGLRFVAQQFYLPLKPAKAQ
ncbi:DUF6748 domain-containing protein [Cellvibrio japonicus]|uniref:DUF6748 domain-containing protein n=1 Tax=Cellvibrio japonicus (strain Ueda107) TaxID=498211 RepID=B3PCS8_CELJU|nr:DUF6748 domain-containing protein [Cellvibrio japonicus]ACE84489.1 hypothetical protein CJA_2988 [Cellvibrio japonicus Ueda107]QEI13297.1 hypothetical protein FY117_14410 [Cellvibrio japonicus]QEI16871.1 hypothetical protein FY116_14415 [Cellvibrio japonicus]QEI20449.1 hypothetical protein FY115_14410 [Cellvibrio japonicus]